MPLKEIIIQEPKQDVRFGLQNLANSVIVCHYSIGKHTRTTIRHIH